MYISQSSLLDFQVQMHEISRWELHPFESTQVQMQLQFSNDSHVHLECGVEGPFGMQTQNHTSIHTFIVKLKEKLMPMLMQVLTQSRIENTRSAQMSVQAEILWLDCVVNSNHNSVRKPQFNQVQKFWILKLKIWQETDEEERREG